MSKAISDTSFENLYSAWSACKAVPVGTIDQTKTDKSNQEMSVFRINLQRGYTFNGLLTPVSKRLGQTLLHIRKQEERSGPQGVDELKYHIPAKNSCPDPLRQAQYLN